MDTELGIKLIRDPKNNATDNALLAPQAVGQTLKQSVKTPGGIDFNPEMLDLETQGEGVDFNLPFDTQNLENISIDGFIPIIYSITPITSLPILSNTPVK